MLSRNAIIWFCGVGLLIGCAKGGSLSGARGGAPSPYGAPADPSAAVAKINGKPITAGELHAEAKSHLAALEKQHVEAIYNAQSQALEALIEKRLLDAKSKGEGLSTEKLLARETGTTGEPTDAEIEQVYNVTKANGRDLPPLPEVKADIARFLKERKGGDARRGYVAKLREAAKVEMLLPPPLLPKVEVAAEGPSKGPASAPVTIVEFSDFQCPFCGRAEETIKQVMDTYKGKVRLVFRDYPLPSHQNAPKASEAAHCAGDQGKYWEMHEKLFANQQALSLPDLKQHAQGLGLDAGKFDKCLDGGEKAKLVEASKKEAEKVGVTGTPAFFINGRPLTGAQPFDKFKAVIDHELAQAVAVR